MSSFRAAPRGLRLHIGIFGRRNVGKSSILNQLTCQDVSIVSDVAGTTTDPVEKPMELLPIGPVLFIDTAGIDDTGVLGEMRNARTRTVFDRTELALLAVDATQGWGQFEEDIMAEFRHRRIPVLVLFNKTDLSEPDTAARERVREWGVGSVCMDALSGAGVDDLRQALIKAVPDEYLSPSSIVGDLVPPGETAVLVTPIDKEAPKGRLIMPQVQTIRDLLDHDACCLVLKERELRRGLERLKEPPVLVITDSQAFLKVAADTPETVPMTSFSVLFARFKGDLEEFVRGAATIERLKPGDEVLIAESCSHHPIEEDIGRVKIPRWLRQYVGGDLRINHCQGHDFPKELHDIKLVIHCAGCVNNRREMLSRLMTCREAGVPMTNYGVVIAYTLGIIERALSPFPSALSVLREGREAVKDHLTKEQLQ